jgi:hypothetical protein
VTSSRLPTKYIFIKDVESVLWLSLRLFSDVSSSVAQRHMVEWVWMINYKGAGRNRSWPILMCYTSRFLCGTEESYKKITGLLAEIRTRGRLSMKQECQPLTMTLTLLGCDRPDDGGSKDLWNVGKLLPDYTVLQPRRQQSSTAILIFVTFSLCILKNF